MRELCSKCGTFHKPGAYCPVSNGLIRGWQHPAENTLNLNKGASHDRAGEVGIG